MHTITSIWVLIAMAKTQTSDGCTEYCNLLLSDELRLFLRPDCMCSLEYQGHRHKKPTKLKRDSSLDKSAIYYEPSDEYPYEKTSFVDYPFYIVNPMYQTQSFKNTENRKVRKIAVNNLDRVDLNRSFRKRIPTESLLRTFDTEAEESPMYLDIDIYKSIKNKRADNMNENEVKQIELTEDDLTECIDLNVLVFSRKIDQNAVSDLKDMLDETKINKYKGLTDSDLMIEIQSKCHQTIKIIDESLQEIKNSWPRKSQLRSSQNIKTVKYQKNHQNQIVINGTDTSRESYSSSEIIPDRELGNMTIPSNELLTETVSLLPKTIYSNMTDYDFSNLASEKKTIVKSFTDTTPEIFKSNSNAGRIHKDFENNIKNSESEIDLQNDLLSQYSNNFHTLTLESTTVVDSSYTDFENLTKNAIKTQTDDIVLAEYTTSKPMVSYQHLVIVEKDMKIPRIFTKEIENSTVISKIEGIELIPNNDFEGTTMMNHDLTNEYSYETSSTTFASTEIKNTTRDLLDEPSNFTNQNVTIILSKDLKGSSDQNKEKLTQGFSNLEINNSLMTNDTESNKLNLEKNVSTSKSTVKNNKNKHKETRYLMTKNESTEIESSNETQTINPEIITILPELRNIISGVVELNRLTTDKSEYLEEKSHLNENLTPISNNTDKNGSKIKNDSVGKHNVIDLQLSDISTTIAMETRDLEYLTRQDTYTTLNYLSLNNSNKNDESQDLSTESGSLENAQKNYDQNIENSTEFSTKLNKTPDLGLIHNKTVKTVSFTNHDVDVVHEFFTLTETENNTTPQSKEETNYSVNEDFSRTTGTVNYSNTSEEIDETTQHYSGNSVSAEFVSYLSIPNTTPSKEHTTPSNQDVSSDISELIDEFILNKNITHDASTDDPRGSETSVISITDRTINVKEDVLFDLTSQDIVGKLYFLFGDKQVPVRFVQNPDGQIKLGFDGETICDKLTEKDNNDSVIIKAICNCSRSKNCMKITNNTSFN